MTRRAVSFIAAFVIITASPAAALTLSNFDSPDSVAIDPADGSYFVSNIGGDPRVKDANGYLSKITPDGNLVIQRFVASKEGAVLNAPQGLWIRGRTVYATDIDTLKGFDTQTGKMTVLVDLSEAGARSLHDVTADSRGDLYLSDAEANLIFKVEPAAGHRVTLVASGDRLGGPTGLLVNPKSKNLMLVTWKSGCLIEIDREGDLHVLKRGLTTLDGIDHDGVGNLYVSSYDKGEIYKIPYLGRGSLVTFASGIVTPADFIYDPKRGEAVVPSTVSGKIQTVSDPSFRKPPQKKTSKKKN